MREARAAKARSKDQGFNELHEFECMQNAKDNFAAMKFGLFAAWADRRTFSFP
jgi:hypothetical protein